MGIDVRVTPPSDDVRVTQGLRVDGQRLGAAISHEGFVRELEGVAELLKDELAGEAVPSSAAEFQVLLRDAVVRLHERGGAPFVYDAETRRLSMTASRTMSATSASIDTQYCFVLDPETGELVLESIGSPAEWFDVPSGISLGAFPCDEIIDLEDSSDPATWEERAICFLSVQPELDEHTCDYAIPITAAAADIRGLAVDWGRSRTRILSTQITAGQMPTPWAPVSLPEDGKRVRYFHVGDVSG